MSNAALIRKLARKVVVLEAATAAARASGDLGPDENIEVTIRKVRASEVTAITGLPPLLLRLARERQEGESDAAFSERLIDRATDDPAVLMAAQKQGDDVQRVTIALGVVDPVVKLDADPDAGELAPEDFGDSFNELYNAVVEFSGLPYQRAAGAGITAFPAGPAGDPDQPSSPPLRDDALAVPGPTAG